MEDLMDTEITVWAGLTIVNLPIFYYMRGLFFRSWSGFFEAIRYWFTPDMWSWCKDEWGHDIWAEFRLGLYAVACVAVMSAELLLIAPLIAK
jgi:hypothetical protein